MFCRTASHEHRSRDVRSEDCFEAGEVEIHKILESAEACVVDENIELAEFLQDFAIGAFDVGFLRYVRMNRMHAQGTCCVGKAALVAPGDRHAGPAHRKGMGDGPSNAAAAAGNQRHRVSQVHLASA